MKEIWYDLPQFDVPYQITVNNRVRRLPYILERSDGIRTRLPGFELKVHSTHDGYLYVTLNDGGEGFGTYLLHRLIASIFLKNPDPTKFTEINHKDGNKHNNTPENLEWVTHHANMVHAFDNGLLSNCISVKCLTNGKIYRSMRAASDDLGVNSDVVKYSIKFNMQRKGLIFVALPLPENFDEDEYKIEARENEVKYLRIQRNKICKPVYAIQNSSLLEFDSITDASKYFKVSDSLLNQALLSGEPLLGVSFIHPDEVKDLTDIKDIETYIMNKYAKHKKGSYWIKCITNGEIYPSIQCTVDSLGISPESVKASISENRSIYSYKQHKEFRFVKATYEDIKNNQKTS